MLEERKSGQFVYIINGVISQKTIEGNGEKRINKKGDEVWEKHFTSISGLITNFSIEETKVGEQLSVRIVDGGETCILQIPVESSYFSSFAAKIGNVNLGTPVKIKTYSFIPKDKDKKISGLNFFQAGEKVEPAITRDKKPDGFPEPEGDTVKYTKDDWKIYFMKKTKWEKEYLSNWQFPKEAAFKKLEDDILDIGAVSKTDEVPF